jgi:hypothetical protein
MGRVAVLLILRVTPAARASRGMYDLRPAGAVERLAASRLEPMANPGRALNQGLRVTALRACSQTRRQVSTIADVMRRC